MPLKIAYLCDHSPLDRNLYSGGNARIYDALCRHAGEVTILPSTWYAAQPVRRMIEALPDHVNMRLRWRVQLALAPVIARGIRADLVRGGYDAVFCAYSLWSLHRLQVPDGMITAFTSDTTQSVFQSSAVGAAFAGGRKLTRLLDPWVERCENRALRAADLVLWPSEWQRAAAQARYGLDPAKVHTVPWGANLDWVEPGAPRALDPNGPVRLLFVGRDWDAKGGPLAVATLKALRRHDARASLTVIGCTPPDADRSDAVEVLGGLDKGKPEDMARFRAAFDQAHFLMQPSLESFGFAFCEASAYGLPSLCIAEGGVPVRNGENGHALPLGTTADGFADLIRSYRADPSRYAALARSTRQTYEARLNWDAWGRRTAALLSQAVEQKPLKPD